ncbi:hypothetical protein [Tardiphaga sp.]|jgi:hypothetical protein|uniref:hypothetical protein n=1 Tax=Tardiphaga sp. TaxID=1926292 RepID=UPI0037D9AD4E
MTTAIHLLMMPHVGYRADSYDPVYSHSVSGRVLHIVGCDQREYEVSLDDVAFWEFVEGPAVNSMEYFHTWLDKVSQIPEVRAVLAKAEGQHHA